VALPWEESTWLDDMTAWVHAHAEVTGEVTVLHRRAWSAMLRADTADGAVFAKAAAPAARHEVPLTLALARWAPEVTVEVLAADVERGWFLARHAGEPVRGWLTRDADLAPLERAYERYARLQAGLADRAESVLSLGVPDRRLARFPDLVADLDVDHGLVRDLVATLQACPLPDTLVHEEIHDANVLLDRQGTPRFIDWADSSVGHPFFGIVVGLRSVSDRLDIAPGEPPLERLLAAYLRGWSDVAPADELRAVIFPAAYRLGMLNRALSWRAFLADLAPAQRAEHAVYVDAWLEEFAAAGDPLPGT